MLEPFKEFKISNDSNFSSILLAFTLCRWILFRCSTLTQDDEMATWLLYCCLCLLLDPFSICAIEKSVFDFPARHYRKSNGLFRDTAGTNGEPDSIETTLAKQSCMYVSVGDWRLIGAEIRTLSTKNKTFGQGRTKVGI